MHMVDTSIVSSHQMYRKRSNLHQGKKYLVSGLVSGLGHHWRCVDLEIISVTVELL